MARIINCDNGFDFPIQSRRFLDFILKFFGINRIGEFVDIGKIDIGSGIDRTISAGQESNGGSNYQIAFFPAQAQTD